MSDEEKKVLEYLKEIYNDYESFFGKEDAAKCQDYKKTKTLIELIEKQQKEIEELKENMRKRIIYCNELEKDLFENCSNYVVSKAKIKAKIVECREILYSFEKELELKANKDKFIYKESMNCLLGQISVLQSLLEKE